MQALACDYDSRQGGRRNENRYRELTQFGSAISFITLQAAPGGVAPGPAKTASLRIRPVCDHDSRICRDFPVAGSHDRPGDCWPRPARRDGREGPMTNGLCLSGGGAKGDFELGAVRCLYDRGIRPDVIISTSVG